VWGKEGCYIHFSIAPDEYDILKYLSSVLVRFFFSFNKSCAFDVLIYHKGYIDAKEKDISALIFRFHYGYILTLID